MGRSLGCRACRCSPSKAVRRRCTRRRGSRRPRRWSATSWSRPGPRSGTAWCCGRTSAAIVDPGRGERAGQLGAARRRRPRHRDRAGRHGRPHVRRPRRGGRRRGADRQRLHGAGRRPDRPAGADRCGQRRAAGCGDPRRGAGPGGAGPGARVRCRRARPAGSTATRRSTRNWPAGTRPGWRRSADGRRLDRHAVWWQVYPLGATGAEREALPADAGPVPRLQAAARPGCRTWSSLGCNGLALGPGLRVRRRTATTPSTTSASTGGWAPRQDLTELIDGLPRARASGCCSTASSTTSAATSRSSARCSSRGRRAGGGLVRHRPAGDGPDGFGYRDFEGHSALVALDHGNPEVADHVAAGA